MANQSADSAGFLKILGQLADSANGYRKAAFVKAAKSLRDSKLPMITVAQASGLPGFGEGILKRLQEFINTEALTELKGVEEKTAVMDLFQGIYGVGPVMAGRWYEKGYRKLSDIPIDSLTPNQKVGLMYYEDLNSKIPREEIDKINGVMDMMVKSFNKKHRCIIKYQICGSYIRGRPTSGDIDMVITEMKGNIHRVIDDLVGHLDGFVEHVLAKGDSKILCVGGLAKVLNAGRRRRIDFELVEPNEWAFATLYFTGSKNFNVHMRGRAKELGYTLNHKGLFSDELSIAATEEQDIFDFLDMKYITPAERDTY